MSGSSVDRRLNIVVGVTGGIAAYKAVHVVRDLVLAGHEVHVIPTEAATRFVGVPTWEAISRRPVTVDLYAGVDEVRHVALGQRADLIIVAPATADFLARAAHGLAGDLLGSALLATSAPVVVAPAMHSEMWEHPATVANVATLAARGVHFVGPGVGQLTGNDSGPGRMSEPAEIVTAALAVVGPRDLDGRRLLVTAGGTREPLDPVRFLGNRSSGLQGVAIARAAAERGADVALVLANADERARHLAKHPRISVNEVATTLELKSSVDAIAPGCDVVIMAAAVADYRPEEIADRKIKKDDQLGDELILRLVKNPDILRGLVDQRHEGQTVIGFAAETEPDSDALLAIGRAKAARKGVDYLVVNRVGWDAVFGKETNAVIVLGAGGEIVAEASGSKATVAETILNLIG